jgi:hypothetical protein
MGHSIYHQLGPDEIRVLDVQSAEGDNEAIECQVRHLPLVTNNTVPSEPLLYATLSYVWGPTYEDCSHLTKAMRCNSHRIPITANLYSALYQILRLALLEDDEGVEPPLPIWVDAVCINQQDTAERNAQVRRMADIYRLSCVTIIWLGMPDDQDLHRSQCNAIDKLKYMGQGKSCYLTRREIADLATITVRPWFSRRWVLQEYVCSREGQGEAWFLFGKHYCQASMLFHKLQEAGNSPTIFNAGALLWNRERESLLKLLNRSVQACGDPRDRVYALRNISADGHWLDVDYGQTFQELYIKVARYYSLTEDLSNLLYCAATQAWNEEDRFKDKDGSIITRCLPSWVPDWRLPSISLNFCPSNHVIATCVPGPNETLAVRGMVSWPCSGAAHRANDNCLTCWLEKRRGQTCCKTCSNSIIALDHSRGHALLLLPSVFRHGALILRSQGDSREIRQTQTFRLMRGYVPIKRCDEHSSYVSWSDAFHEPLPNSDILLV